jgi:hypothetical protein
VCKSDSAARIIRVDVVINTRWCCIRTLCSLSCKTSMTLNIQPHVFINVNYVDTDGQTD